MLKKIEFGRSKEKVDNPWGATPRGFVLVSFFEKDRRK